MGSEKMNTIALARAVASFRSAALGLALCLSACSSVPEDKMSPESALLADPPAELVKQVELSFRKRIAFIDDSQITRYLQRLTTRVFPPGRKSFDVEVVSTAVAGFAPSVWATPGGKIFFDIRVLRALKFENEIAAALSFAWDRSEGVEFRERLIQEAARADPDPMRVWIFGEVENQRAIEASVGRLYKAGYDPRGLVSYFDRIPNRSTQAVDSETETLKDKTRRAITFYAPLLNPIVRTEDFYKMRKRLERL